MKWENNGNQLVLSVRVSLVGSIGYGMTFPDNKIAF